MSHVADTDAPRLGAWHIPRSRGAASGLLLMLLGIWGALIPFIGPYFHFGFTPDSTWTWTSARFWLQVLPGIATFVAGVLLLASANRGTAVLGAWLAIAAGAWFVLGPTLTTRWDLGALGSPLGGSARQALEWISFFYGLGAVILFLGSTAWGRLSVRAVRDVAAARRRRERRADQAELVAPAAVAEREVYPSDRPAASAPTGDRGYRAAGQPVAGEPTAGQPTAGRTNAGRTNAGRTNAGNGPESSVRPDGGPGWSADAERSRAGVSASDERSGVFGRHRHRARR